MSNEKKEKSIELVKKLVDAKPSVDFPVDVIATEADPYHETGTVFQAGTKKAKELVKRGWVTMATMIALILVSSLGVVAQVSVLTDLKSIYNLSSDTVTNTATVYLQSVRIAGAAQTTTIQVNVTKISGTVGGTISLQGSLDGTNYKALNTSETQTALATITATDATNVYHWRLNYSPFLYYRVSWTGTGTMAASFTAKLMKH